MFISILVLFILLPVSRICGSSTDYAIIQIGASIAKQQSYNHIDVLFDHDDSSLSSALADQMFPGQYRFLDGTTSSNHEFSDLLICLDSKACGSISGSNFRALLIPNISYSSSLSQSDSRIYLFDKEGNISEKHPWGQTRHLHNLNALDLHDLEGHTLKCALLLTKGSVELSNDGVSLVGYEIELLNILAERLHFKLEFVHSVDGSYGNQLENSSWNGMVGMLERGEADLALPFLAMTQPRTEAVDFTKAVTIYRWGVLA